MADLETEDDTAEEVHDSNIDKIKEQARVTQLIEGKKRKEQEFRVKLLESNLAQQMFLWMQKKWMEMLLLQVALIATGALLGVTGRILWEIWKTIFAVQL